MIRLLERVGTTWSYSTTVLGISDEPVVDDHYLSDIEISNGSLIAGNTIESGSSPGVDGDRELDAPRKANPEGAAYVFEVPK